MMSSMARAWPTYIKEVAEGLVLLFRWKLKKKVLPSVQDFKMKAALSLVVMMILIATCFNQCYEGDPLLKGVFDECVKKHQIGKEVVESIVNYDDVPDYYAIKCWLSCVMTNLGMIEDGKINWEHCRNIIKQDLTSEEDRAKVDKIVEICQAEVSQDEKDECQLAFSAALCKIKNWRKLGLPKNNMEFY